MTMKRFVFIIALLLYSFVGYAQFFTEDQINSYQSFLDDKFAEYKDSFVFTDDGIAVQKVLTSEGSKDQLYDKILEFLTRTFKDSNEVIQVKEKDSGLIICKGLYTFNVNEMDGYGQKVNNNVYHIIKAECKDGRIRLTITIDNIELLRSSTDEVEIKYLDDLYTSFTAVPVDFDIMDFDQAMKREAQLFEGFQIYHCIKYMLFLTDELNISLNQKSVLDTGDDW